MMAKGTTLYLRLWKRNFPWMHNFARYLVPERAWLDQTNWPNHRWSPTEPSDWIWRCLQELLVQVPHCKEKKTQVHWGYVTCPSIHQASWMAFPKSISICFLLHLSSTYENPEKTLMLGYVPPPWTMFVVKGVGSYDDQSLSSGQVWLAVLSPSLTLRAFCQVSMVLFSEDWEEGTEDDRQENNWCPRLYLSNSLDISDPEMDRVGVMEEACPHCEDCVLGEKGWNRDKIREGRGEGGVSG